MDWILKHYLQLDELWWVFQTSEVDEKLAPVNVGP
jgi:hypothetical protein